MTAYAQIVPLTPDALVLRTTRLVFRPLSMDDLDMARQTWCDPEVMKFIGEMSKPDELASDLLEATARGAGGRIGIWSMALRETGEKIGYTVLTPMPVDSAETDWMQVTPEAYPTADVEVGYVMVPAAWGKGYATEACGRMLDFAFQMTALEVVVATTDPDNHVSQRVLLKSGLTSLGAISAYGVTDCPGFRITRAEWSALSG